MQATGLFKNESARPDNIQPVIMKPLADIVADPMCKRFRASVKQGELLNDRNPAAL